MRPPSSPQKKPDWLVQPEASKKILAPPQEEEEDVENFPLLEVPVPKKSTLLSVCPYILGKWCHSAFLRPSLAHCA